MTMTIEVAAMAVKFDATRVRGAERHIESAQESHRVGREIAADLAGPELRAIFVLSDGTRVNGTDLVRGLREVAGDHVVVTGGLAGDGARFGATRTGLGAGPASALLEVTMMSDSALISAEQLM